MLYVGIAPKNHLVPDAPVIFGSADQDAYRFVLIVAAEHVIDKGRRS